MSSSRLSFRTGIIASIFILILACSQSLYVPSAETVSDPFAIEELLEGRKLYIKNCSSCHNLYSPQKYPAEHWTKEMDEMKVEAKITDAQAVLILKYLTYSPKIHTSATSTSALHK